MLVVLVAVVCGAVGQTGTSPYSGGVVVLNSTEPNPWTPAGWGFINAPTYVFGAVQTFNVTAFAANVVPLTDSCSFTNCAVLAGKIVLYSLGGFCSHAYKAQIISQCGGVGAIFGELSFITPSWDSMAMDQVVAPQLTIPVSMVGVDVTQWILRQIRLANASGIPLQLRMVYQPDGWYQWMQEPSGVFVQTIFCISFGLVGVVATVKLALFVKEQGLKFTVPQACLFLTIFCCIFYAIAITLNLLGSRNNTSQLTMIILREWVTTLWVMPVLIFPFYWGELMASSSAVVGLKWSIIILFGAASFIIQGFTLGVLIVKGLYGNNLQVIQAQLATICILCGLAGIFFSVQGIRVIVALQKMQGGALGNTQIQRRTIFLFLSLAVLLFCISAKIVCGFAPGVGILFPNFALFYLFKYVLAALALGILAFTLVPTQLKKENLEASIGKMRSRRSGSFHRHSMSKIYSGAPSSGPNSSGSTAVDSVAPSKEEPKGSAWPTGVADL